MKNLTQRFTNLLLDYFGETNSGTTQLVDHKTILIKACLAILNEKLAEGFQTPEEENGFYQASLPLYISLSGFISRKSREPHPHWISGNLFLPSAGSGVLWTGSTTEGTELLYGLIHAGLLNHGRATIVQGIKWFEWALGRDLKNASKVLQDIRNRKKEIATIGGRIDQGLLRFIDLLEEEEFHENIKLKRA